MDQQQTNTLFVFLLITIFQFAGYSILTGNPTGGNNSIAVIVMLVISGLFTGIYYLISAPTRIPIAWSNIKNQFVNSTIRVFIFVFFVGLFLIISVSVIISWAGFDTIKDVGIGVLTGIVSGAVIIFMQCAFFNRGS